MTSRHAGSPGERTAAAGPPDPNGMEVVLDPRHILRIMVWVIAVLVILSTAGQVMAYNLPDFPLRDGIANLFFVAREQSLPTLFSLVMLLASALLTGAISRSHGRAGGPYVRHWAALSFLFVLLAIDEQASLHEQTSDLLRGPLDIAGGPLWFAWVVPAVALVAAFVIAFLRFIRHLPRLMRRRLLTAGLLFVGGAIGLEMVGGWWYAIHGELNPTYVVITTVEETLEMLGLSVLVYALLAYIPVGLPAARWRLQIAAPR
ncbi:MAG: hypothetical protein ACREA0_12905 [bacterium]